MLNELTDRFPHREKQIRELFEAVGDELFPNSLIHVYGGPSSGKTSVVNAVLAAKKVPHVYLTCYECSTLTSLFRRVLRHELWQFEHQSTSRESRKSKLLSEKIDEFDTDLFKKEPNSYFVKRFISVINQLCLKRFVVILDDVERVFDYKDGRPFYHFISLSERLARRSITLQLVVISGLQWSTLTAMENPNSQVVPSTRIPFPNYNKAQLVDVLTTLSSKNYDADMVRRYANEIVKLLYQQCHDLLSLHCELQRQLQIKRSGDASDVIKFMKEEKNLALSTKFCTFRSHERDLENRLLRNQDDAPLLPTISDRYFIHYMDRSSKYLLISSYLASYNPKKIDKRYFLKLSKPTRHYEQRTRGCFSDPGWRDNQCCHLWGPKAFTLERLIMIFLCVINIDASMSMSLSFNDRLLTQIASLHSGGCLIERKSRPDMLHEPKYLCIASHQLVDAVAKSVGFELRSYLYDLADG